MKTRARTKGFTLIELLVVIAIIGVLFAVAMPVFESAGRKDTDRAAYQMMTTLRLARQHAINKRQFTLVLFPTRVGGAYAGADIDKCLQAYAVLANTNRMDNLAKTNQTPNRMSFVYISDWKYLPSGIYFDDDPRLPNNVVTNIPAMYEYPIRPGPDSPMRCMAVVMFKPNGRVYILSTSATNPRFYEPSFLQPARLYLTSAKYYEQAGGMLLDPQTILGTNSTLQIEGKSGQVSIRDR